MNSVRPHRHVNNRHSQRFTSIDLEEPDYDPEEDEGEVGEGASAPLAASPADSRAASPAPYQEDMERTTSVCSGLVTAFIRWLPVLFVSLVLAWSYYTFVFCVAWGYFHDEDDANDRPYAVLVTVYHVLLCMATWCLARTVFTPPGGIPLEWHLTHVDVERLAEAASETEWKKVLEHFVAELDLPVHQFSVQGAVRYCEHCQAVKPDRAHHCSVCQVCVAKMDHHCPWVNNCIGFRNYKMFLLFMLYAYAFTALLSMSLGLHSVRVLSDDTLDAEERSHRFSLHVAFILLLALLFFVFLSCLLWYHLFLLLINRTTLEQFRHPIFKSGPQVHAWNRGKWNNFLLVFGNNPLLWLLPVYTATGDGITFPTAYLVQLAEQEHEEAEQERRNIGGGGGRVHTNGRVGGTYIGGGVATEKLDTIVRFDDDEGTSRTSAMGVGVGVGVAVDVGVGTGRVTKNGGSRS